MMESRIYSLLRFLPFIRLTYEEGVPRMKAKNFLAISMLVVLMGLVGGCHYGSYDDHRDYGYSSSSGSYREGFRDGRAYERRRDDWGASRYSDRYGYYRR
jgi:hypothetical protein